MPDETQDPGSQQIGVQPLVTCVVCFELTDGDKIYNMEKTFRLPCWMQEGMRLDLGYWAWPEVSYVTTNPATCEQHAHVSGSLKREPNELESSLKDLKELGWIVESEDRSR
jgi:hypothetical protein